MQMISFVFFAFAAVVFFALRLTNKLAKDDGQKVKVTKWILLAASYLFVAYADILFALVLAALTVIVWLCAKNKKNIKWGILAAILALGFFKYTNFFMESFCRLVGKDFTALNIILPLGISFYTFSAIGYLIDVNRGKEEVRSFVDVATYLSFFPKLTSGPIQRSKEFFTELNRTRNPGWESFSTGLQIFVFGMFKKLVLADRLSVFVNQVFNTPMAFGGGTILLAVLAYALQIYFDFSGYSDIAVGAARIFDIHLPRNFNLPYLSRNVTELWKRWHISLSSWLQDYLYISLGGNRKGVVRTYVNLILTMVIGGIWHGASWNFIIWGLLHGVSLAVHKLWMQLTGSAKKEQGPLTAILSTLVTFLFVCVTWVFFRASTFRDAMTILGRILTFSPGVQHMNIWVFFAAGVFAAGAVAAMIASRGKKPTGKYKNQSPVDAFYPILDLTKFWHLVLFFVFCGLILGLAYTGGSPFLYGAF